MTEATHRKVRLFGEPRSPQGYALRDFLQRSVVAFEWVELSGDEDRARHLGETDGANLRLPIVELPNGHRLFAPTVRELAEQLGWVSAPKLREYDVSIYGAGPGSRRRSTLRPRVCAQC